jgi:hypothetical protein
MGGFLTVWQGTAGIQSKTRDECNASHGGRCDLLPAVNRLSVPPGAPQIPGSGHRLLSRFWNEAGVLTGRQRALHEQARLSRGRLLCASVAILDSQWVKTTERVGFAISTATSGSTGAGATDRSIP